METDLYIQLLFSQTAMLDGVIFMNEFDCKNGSTCTMRSRFFDTGLLVREMLKVDCGMVSPTNHA